MDWISLSVRVMKERLQDDSPEPCEVPSSHSACRTADCRWQHRRKEETRKRKGKRKEKSRGQKGAPWERSTTGTPNYPQQCCGPSTTLLLPTPDSSSLLLLPSLETLDGSSRAGTLKGAMADGLGGTRTVGAFSLAFISKTAESLTSLPAVLRQQSLQSRRVPTRRCTSRRRSSSSDQPLRPSERAHRCSRRRSLERGVRGSRRSPA